MLIEIVVCVLLLVGAGFALVGSIGLARLPDFFMRLHGPTKGTTLGVGSIAFASLLYFSTNGGGVSVHEILLILFLFLTAPISAHLASKAAIHLQVASKAPKKGTEQID